MSKKILIQPGVWVILIALGMAGIFFGVKTLQKNGGLSKLTNAVAPPAGGTQTQVKAVKVGGKKPLLVAVNTWVGFAPGVYFNNGFTPTENSRFYSECGVAVQFIKMDNFDDSRRAWSTDNVDIICNTADVLSTEMPNFIQFNPKTFIQIDWSRGGDKVIARPGINTVADLIGKTIAVALNSPSQTLIIKTLEAGGLKYADIKDNIKPCATAMEAATMFKAGQVDAAIVWAPDDADCIAAFPGSKVLISTKEAAFAISDIFYAKQSFIDSHRQELTGFVEGWLKASRELNSSPEARTKATALMSSAFGVPEAVMDLNFARFTTYGDNVNFFGLSPVNCECVKGEDLYSKMAKAFVEIGMAQNNIPAWRDITDVSIIQSLKNKFTDPNDAPESGISFSAPTPEHKTVTPIATKRITINFETGSYTLTDEAKYIIDKDFGNVAKSFAGFRVRIEGNTDNVGSMQNNLSLSKKRAQSVADYLINTYSFDSNRFVILGNGPNKPIDSNDTPEGKAANRRTDFELIQ